MKPIWTILSQKTVKSQDGPQGIWLYSQVCTPYMVAISLQAKHPYHMQ